MMTGVARVTGSALMRRHTPMPASRTSIQQDEVRRLAPHVSRPRASRSVAPGTPRGEVLLDHLEDSPRPRHEIFSRRPRGAAPPCADPGFNHAHSLDQEPGASRGLARRGPDESGLRPADDRPRNYPEPSHARGARTGTPVLRRNRSIVLAAERREGVFAAEPIGPASGSSRAPGTSSARTKSPRKAT